MKFETISVIGLGYIGLPTAAVFASRKIKVIGVDVNQDAVDTINRGEIHIVEPDLDMLVHAAVKEGYLRASMIPEPADAFLVAVPTPFTGKNHEPDLSYIESAAITIAPVLKRGDLVILESTSPVGATEKMEAWLQDSRPDLSFPSKAGNSADIKIAHCPERVLPGHVIRELVENDRIIGGITESCSAAAVELYRTFVRGDCLVTNARTAEMTKLTENAFRDVNIAFANELSLICGDLDIDVWELIRLANKHPRVGILHPGPGVGGHCIAVDPWFIVSQSPDNARLIRIAREVNDYKPQYVKEQVDKTLVEYLRANPQRSIDSVSIACFGLTFKPNIDDLRESPALQVSRNIAKSHPGQVLMVEPNIQSLPDSEKMENQQLVSLESAMELADIFVFLVKHKEFLGQKFDSLKFVVDPVGVFSA